MFKFKEVGSCNCQQTYLLLAIISEFESQDLENFYPWHYGNLCMTSGTTEWAKDWKLENTVLIFKEVLF